MIQLTDNNKYIILKKASELLYTEEQVRQVYRIAASDTHKALLPELEDEAIQYIQSLKQ